MTLRHLRIFVNVYQCGSITETAKLMHIAQPSVSLAIRELETHYNTKMFDRISRRIYPTESGNHFYEHALQIITLYEKMEHEFLNHGYPSILKIGASTNIGSQILPKIVSDFKTLSPSIQVSVIINNFASIQQDILDNTIDIALVEAEPLHSKLSRIPFIKDRLCIVCSPDHPLATQKLVTLQELAAHDFLLSEKGTANRDFFEGILSYYKINIEPIWKSINSQSIIFAVMQGLGISFFPHMLIEQELEQGLLKELPLSDIDLSRSYFISYHQNKYLPPAAKTFIHLCQNFIS